MATSSCAPSLPLDGALQHAAATTLLAIVPALVLYVAGYLLSKRGGAGDNAGAVDGKVFGLAFKLGGPVAVYLVFFVVVWKLTDTERGRNLEVHTLYTIEGTIEPDADAADSLRALAFNTSVYSIQPPTTAPAVPGAFRLIDVPLRNDTLSDVYFRISPDHHFVPQEVRLTFSGATASDTTYGVKFDTLRRRITIAKPIPLHLVRSGYQPIAPAPVPLPAPGVRPVAGPPADFAARGPRTP